MEITNNLVIYGVTRFHTVKVVATRLTFPPITFSKTIPDKQVKHMNITLDIELSNFQDAKVINSNGSVYLLNGIDLFSVINMTSKTEDISNLKKVGSLGGVENQMISDIKVRNRYRATRNVLKISVSNMDVGITLEKLYDFCGRFR